MITKEQFEELSNEEKIVFLYGSSSYTELTHNRTTPVSYEVARKLSDDEIVGVLHYTQLDNTIDFESDKIALDTVTALCKVLSDRHQTPKEDIEAKWDDFRAKYLGGL